MGQRDYTVYDFIADNAMNFPDQCSIVFDDRCLTHKEYKERCDKLASGFIRLGISEGDRVGIVAHNCDELMILYGAAAKLGAILVPVNWRFSQEDVEYILKDCAPKVIFAGPEYRQAAAESAGRIDSIMGCFAIGGGELPRGFRQFEELYTEVGNDESLHISADSGFIIIYASTAESRPRGALLSQANVVFANVMFMQQYNLGSDDVHLCILPLFHTAGIGMAMAVMHAGGKNVIVERFDPELSLQLIERERGTVFFSFPPILKRIIEKQQELSCDISSIRNVMGLDPPDVIERFVDIVPGVTYWSGYAQTEAMAVTACPFHDNPGSVGKPYHLTKVALFDDYDNGVPTGIQGEICVRSPVVFLGYWGMDDDTAYAFRNGWHHTGDIGRFDDKGYLFFVKRKPQREIIKPGGENVYPSEVEKAILDHEAIEEVCVIGVPDAQWGEAIKAVCVLKPGQSLIAQELIDFVASRIARYKKPRYVVYVDALPKTAEGEIDRDRVKKDHCGQF
jgi:acyl-CoA synthetase (AMP-forming)/AMP-acid ligase II